MAVFQHGSTEDEARWTCFPGGYLPPVGIYVEFRTHEGDVRHHVGVTAQRGLTYFTPRGELHSMAETVFVAYHTENAMEQVYPDVFTCSEVACWRQTRLLGPQMGGMAHPTRAKVPSA